MTRNIDKIDLISKKVGEYDGAASVVFKRVTVISRVERGRF